MRKLFSRILLIATCLVLVYADSAAAVDMEFNDDKYPVDQKYLEFDLDFNVANGAPFYDGQNFGSCSAMAPGANGTEADLQTFDPDPQAVKFYENTVVPAITGKPGGQKSLIELYQAAAKAENIVDWEMLAGIHNIELGLSRKNVTNSYGFKTMWQMGRAEINGAGDIDGKRPNYDDAIFQHGRLLNDDEFIFVTRVAIRIMKSKAAAKTVQADMSKPMNFDKIGRIATAYNAGQASKWLTGGADPTMMPYSWAGFDKGARKLPMRYEQGTIAKPGVVTVVGLMRKNNPQSGITNQQTCNATEAALGGDIKGLPADRAAINAEILKLEQAKIITFTGYCTGGSVARMRAEVTDGYKGPGVGGIKDPAARGLLAMGKFSGVTNIPVTCLNAGHEVNKGWHPKGLGIDIDYNSPGDPNPDKTGNGLKMQKWVLANYQALGADEYYWMASQEPNCVQDGKVRKCTDTGVAGHRDHAHIGFNP